MYIYRHVCGGYIDTRYVDDRGVPAGIAASRIGYVIVIFAMLRSAHGMHHGGQRVRRTGFNFETRHQAWIDHAGMPIYGILLKHSAVLVGIGHVRKEPRTRRWRCKVSRGSCRRRRKCFSLGSHVLLFCYLWADGDQLVGVGVSGGAAEDD